MAHDTVNPCWPLTIARMCGAFCIIGFMHPSELDSQTVQAVQAFRNKLGRDFPVEKTILFGSRARNTHAAQSDADVAVVLQGPAGSFIDTKFAMNDVAYEVLLDTGIRIQPLPIWHDEWDAPERCTNPQLILNIQREGVAL